MDVPSRLADWSLDLIDDLVASDAHEGDTWDFKEVLTSSNPRFNDELRKAACSFANTRWGFLVIGVKDAGPAAERVVGIPTSRENVRELVQKLQAVEPALATDSVRLPLPDPTREILVAEILPSPIAPHAFHTTARDYQFWRRAEGTARRMTYRERQEAMMNQGERIARMQVVYTSLAETWTRLAAIRGAAQQHAHAMYAPDVSQLRQYLGEVQAQCPAATPYLFTILQVCDIVTTRLEAIRALSRSALMNGGQVIAAENTNLVRNIDEVRETFERAMLAIAARFDFAPVPTGLGTIPPIP